MNEITGNIKLIGETNTYGASFRKREFVVTTPGDYPQDIKLEFYQDDCAKLNTFGEGDEVTVSYNLKGNEYQGKYYVNLQAWKISLNTEEAAEDSKPAPKKRGRPKKKAEPQPETTEDLAADVNELADAPF